MASFLVVKVQSIWSLARKVLTTWSPMLIFTGMRSDL